MKSKFLKGVPVLAGTLMCVLVAASGTALAADQTAQPVNIDQNSFPDSAFRQYVSTVADADHNNSLSESEIKSITNINLRGTGVENLTGIEKFTGLRTLDCSDNKLKKLNLSGNTLLETVNASGNDIVEAELSKNASLMNLDLSENELTKVDLKECKSLISVNLSYNELQTIDFTGNQYVSSVNVSHNDIVLADFTANEALTYTDCSYNKLIGLKCAKSTDVLIADHNELSVADFKEAKNIRNINLSANNLYRLDVSACEKLTSLNVADNNLFALDLSANKNLKQENINCQGNGGEMFVANSNEASIRDTGIVLDKITEIKENDVKKGETLVIGKDGKVPEEVHYTYDFGNKTKGDFVIKPVTEKKLVLPVTKADIFLTSNEKQPEYPFSAIALGTETNIKWTSSDSKVATVTENGLVSPVSVGTATLTASADGYDSVKVEISVYKEGTTVGIDSIPVQIYTGKEITPVVTVKLSDTTLVKDTDYTVAYKNNINVGTATVTVTGKGRYSFVKTAEFKICYNISGVVADTIPDQMYTGKEVTPAVVLKNATVTLVKDKDYTLAYTNNTAIGTAIITITGKGDYTGTKIVSFNIAVPQVKNLTCSIHKKTSLTLTWNKISGVAGYRIYRYNNTTKKYEYLKQLNGEDAYTYTDANLTAGTKYKYRVRAFVLVGAEKKYGTYSAKYKTYTNPKKVTLKVKAGARGTRKAILSWKKTTYTTGYRIYMKKGNGSFKKIKELKGSTKVSYTKTRLSKGSTYYFKVRAYKTINGKNNYGSYSTIKTVVAR